MSAYFITGSGTDVGKTFVTCLLIRQFLSTRPGKNTDRSCKDLSTRSGLNLHSLRSSPTAHVKADRSCKDIHAIKPIISGYDEEQSDTRAIAKALGLAWDEATAQRISPWRFAASLSPHLAAEKEQRPIETGELFVFCRCAVEAVGEKILLIEGVGGVMTPVNRTLLTADWIAALAIPAILVAGSYLGSISHALTAYESLAQRGVPLAGVIISESAGSAVSLADATNSLRQFLPAPCPILALPRRTGDDSIGADAPDLTRLFA